MDFTKVSGIALIVFLTILAIFLISFFIIFLVYRKKILKVSIDFSKKVDNPRENVRSYEENLKYRDLEIRYPNNLVNFTDKNGKILQNKKVNDKVHKYNYTTKPYTTKFCYFISCFSRSGFIKIYLTVDEEKMGRNLRNNKNNIQTDKEFKREIGRKQYKLESKRKNFFYFRKEDINFIKISK